MPVRQLLLALAFATTACAAVDRIVHPSARLRLGRVGASAALLDVPVEATFCAADTTLTIVGADRSWSVALALRTPWPPASRQFVVDSAIGGAGTAALAMRPLQDSIGAAVMAVRGSVSLDAGARLSGALDLVVVRRDTLHLVGSFTAVTPASGGCPAP